MLKVDAGLSERLIEHRRPVSRDSGFFHDESAFIYEICVQCHLCCSLV
jgi:hypothetical protein